MKDFHLSSVSLLDITSRLLPGPPPGGPEKLTLQIPQCPSNGEVGACVEKYECKDSADCGDIEFCCRTNCGSTTCVAKGVFY